MSCYSLTLLPFCPVCENYWKSWQKCSRGFPFLFFLLSLSAPVFLSILHIQFPSHSAGCLVFNHFCSSFCFFFSKLPSLSISLLLTGTIKRICYQCAAHVCGSGVRARNQNGTGCTSSAEQAFAYEMFCSRIPIGGASQIKKRQNHAPNVRFIKSQ